MWGWYESHQTFDDKINSLRERVKTIVANAVDNKTISLKGMDSVSMYINADIDRVKEKMDSVHLEQVVTDGLRRFQGKGYDNAIIMDIGNIYYRMVQISKVDLKTEIDVFFSNNIQQTKLLTYE